jgi:alkaline phosphatase
MRRAIALAVFLAAVGGTASSQGVQRPAPAARAAAATARNVILFIGDAGGLATLNAASLYGYDRPQALFIQQMPHIALMDTSAADRWVTDSAAGMTAIVTGRKTNNGVLSQSTAAVRGKSDGEALATILEYAEERGLSTGVITNDSIAGATPAVCYAHTNDRRNTGEIIAQLLQPRVGDGVDLVLGAGRRTVHAAAEARGLDLDAAMRERGYTILDAPGAVPRGLGRVIALTDDSDFDLSAAVAGSVDALSRNRKGFFLMVEWDLHTDDPGNGLRRTLVLDNVIRETVSKVGPETLVLFAADHSFDIRLRAGRQGQPLITEAASGETAPANPPLRVDDGHSGEEVVVAAQGPGAQRVRGFIANTDLFRIMMAAYGWREHPLAR